MALYSESETLDIIKESFQFLTLETNLSTVTAEKEGSVSIPNSSNTDEIIPPRCRQIRELRNGDRNIHHQSNFVKLKAKESQHFGKWKKCIYRSSSCPPYPCGPNSRFIRAKQMSSVSTLTREGIHYGSPRNYQSGDLNSLLPLVGFLDQDDFKGPLNLAPSDLSSASISSTNRTFLAGCSVQARRQRRNSGPPGPSVNELAAYFDELVYIPKDMSCMAMNMYA